MQASEILCLFFIILTGGENTTAIGNYAGK
jgi:hypothetical protein